MLVISERLVFVMHTRTGFDCCPPSEVTTLNCGSRRWSESASWRRSTATVLENDVTVLIKTTRRRSSSAPRPTIELWDPPRRRECPLSLSYHLLMYVMHNYSAVIVLFTVYHRHCPTLLIWYSLYLCRSFKLLQQPTS